MREKKDCRYFTFPIVLLDGIFENKKRCLNQIFDYSTYKKSLDYEGNESERYKQALKYLRVTAGNEKKSIENGKYLIYSIPTGSPLTSLEKDVCENYYSNESEYPTYDNYDAININKVADIPMDYKGLMGVPITFIDKYNPEQFEILGIDRVLVEEATGKVSRFRIDDKEIYARVIIKNKRI